MLHLQRAAVFLRRGVYDSYREQECSSDRDKGLSRVSKDMSVIQQCKIKKQDTHNKLSQKFNKAVTGDGSLYDIIGNDAVEGEDREDRESPSTNECLSLNAPTPSQ